MLKGVMQLLGRLSAGALAGVTAAAAATTCVVMLLAGPLLLTGTQHYPDIVVGDITMSDMYKHGDIQAAFTAMALFFTVWWVLALLVAWRCPPRLGQENEDPESGLKWLLPLFFCYFAGIVLLRKDAAVVESGLALVLLMVGIVLVRLRQDRQIVFGLLAGLVTAGGLFFTALGLGVAAKFFFPQTLLGLVPSQFPLIVGCLGLLAAGFLWRLSERMQVSLAQGSQLLTPLLLLIGFCRVYQGAAGLSPNLVSLPVKGAVVAVVVAFIALNLRQFLRRRLLLTVAPRDLVLRPAVMAVAAFLAFTLPAFLELDMFHAGELFLTWQQVFEKGQFPFSGFAIARGFGDAVISLVNILFFAGNYSTFSFSVPVYAMGISALNALLFCSLLGNGWGAVLALAAAAPPYCNVSMFLPVFLVLVQPKLLARPLRWLFAWSLLSVGLCLYHTTNGIALTAGTMPVAAWVCFGVIKDGYLREAWQHHRLRVLASIALLLVVLILLVPLLGAWLTYLKDQGEVNELANGTALLSRLALPSWFRWQNRWVFEGVRIGGWLVGCFLLWHQFVRERLRKFKQSGSSLPGTVEALALAGIASTIAFIPYSMGRIDGKGLSRTGSVAMMVLCIMVPVVILLARKGRQGPVLCGAVFLLGIGASAYYEPPSAMARKALAAVTLPADAQLVDGPAMGLPNVGTAFVDSEMLANLLQLKRVTDRFIRPGESYLDLTNHVGYYYLLDYRVPSLYAGYYIVTNETLQKKVIDRLTKNPPPMVLAAPSRTFGSGTAALRSYRLYRWLLLKGYVPVFSDGLAVLVRPDRYQELSAALPPMAEQARMMTMVFAEESLAGIPLAWGKNMAILGGRFRKGAQTLREISRTQGRGWVEEGVVPMETHTLATNEPIRGADLDFMQLQLAATGSAAQLRVSWRVAGGEYAEWRSLVFDVQSGVPLLVPLGAHPDWLLATDITDLRFEFIGSQGGGSFSTMPTFMKLIK